jgi:hypothetical protein
MLPKEKNSRSKSAQAAFEKKTQRHLQVYCSGSRPKVINVKTSTQQIIAYCRVAKSIELAQVKTSTH